jgi:hypothetical protein
MSKNKIINTLSEAQGTLDFFYRLFDNSEVNQDLIKSVILKIQEVIDEFNRT